MSGKLIDTNVIIKLLNGDTKTIELFDSIENIMVSIITAGELLYGAYKSSKVKENLEIFNEFLSEYPLLPIDENISAIYGQLKANLVKQGINIPENDLWIAATAKSNDLYLVTYDTHFTNIDGLKLFY
jgi:Predicted nucleic acid-binding protein, contains PIN domain